MWLDDCEQKIETDLSKPFEYRMIKENYYDSFGRLVEGRIIETTCYKKDEFGNTIKWITR